LPKSVACAHRCFEDGHSLPPHQDILARETNDEVATSLLAQMVELATQQSNPDR